MHIEQLVSDATFSLGYGFDEAWQGPMAELYQLLIAPIEPLLGEHSSLIVIPDGVLRRLPFAALRDADGGLLIQRASVSVSPSLAYTQPGEAGRALPNVLAASLSHEVNLARGRFPALAGTREEGDMAAGLGDPAHIVGQHLQNFRANDLRMALRTSPVDILHLATHASFNGRSDRAFIVADGEAILLSELRQLLGANYARGELISLIVLSACETALGDDQASMGLAGSAVQAGAESAVASLWEVDDAGTLELMRHFYRFYADGQGKAEAIRNAQLELINSGNADFAEPRVWAAFTLLGAWR
jgi:CHAT domain-containing protein